MGDLLDFIGNLQDCPWSHWRPATLHFCEAWRCERIVTPGETWTNVGYFLFGFALLFVRRPPKGSHARGVRTRYGIWAIVVGIFSTLYHASHTWVFETLDLASMQLLGTDLVVTNLRRIGWLRSRPFPFALVLFLGGVGLIFGTTGALRLSVFAAFAAVATYLEARLYARGRLLAGPEGLPALRAGYRDFVWSLILFAVAYAAWLLDYHRIVCDPDQHLISGHGVWHLLNSACFLTLARFYSVGAGSRAPGRPNG